MLPTHSSKRTSSGVIITRDDSSTKNLFYFSCLILLVIFISLIFEVIKQIKGNEFIDSIWGKIKRFLDIAIYGSVFLVVFFIFSARGDMNNYPISAIITLLILASPLILSILIALNEENIIKL